MTEVGQMQIRFRARFAGVPLKAFAWGAITDFDYLKNAKPVEIIPGEFREYTVDFSVEGHLAKLTFDFGAATGDVDFAWIALYRRRGDHHEVIKEWNYSRSMIG